MNLQKYSLNLIVERLESMLRRIIGEDIKLTITLGNDPLNVHADKVQIDQVLLNLAANARDAMPKGGELSITTEYIVVAGEFLHKGNPVAPGCYALLAVSDSGGGMDEETQKRVFEPFFTTKELGRGTGLGLAIVYGIVKQHGGYIYVESGLGKGTTFRMYLPAAMGVPDGSEQDVAQELPPSGSETILVVEDEEPVRNLVRSLLTKYGYEVILAVDGQDAIDTFRAHSKKIKLVLMDVIMPTKNGREAAEEIVKLNKDIKFLFTSGYTADIIKTRGELEHDADLLIKPVDPHLLLNKIRDLLGVTA